VVVRQCLNNLAMSSENSRSTCSMGTIVDKDTTSKLTRTSPGDKVKACNLSTKCAEP